eukprot:TRINITY_DN287_c0_g1_i5.p1 TRINITY_DN287_c0_g1~~TRINITY_DN287_c0_g1_i5.p1  ORF type:complete len:525 (+),score=211.83 TRINITY_DN287_c0_g1_i5:46-1575(+)
MALSRVITRLLSTQAPKLGRSLGKSVTKIQPLRSSLFARHAHTNSTPVKSDVKGMLTVEQLTDMVSRGEIETVLVVGTDIYGRNVGKRFDAEFFLNDGLKNGTHGCDYLYACDMNMDPIHGFKFANWERGFGDVHFVPDLSTLRVAAWQEKTAMVFCDMVDDKTHKYVSVAPRSVLRKQIDAAGQSGYNILAASELEYFIFQTSYREAFKKGYVPSELKSVSDCVEDYHTLQTSREEVFNAPARRFLKLSGVPVENSKGEAGVGQHELNVRYSDILTMSDRHQVYKQCLKEVADKIGYSVTFMAKPFHDNTGSGCHIHLSLWNGDKNAFVGDNQLGPVKCSDVFKYFLGGWIKHTSDVMPFYAPTINSYKRFQTSSWAPTRLVWSYDNRTAGYRVVGSGKSLRIECRIPGADVNPYLAFAASLASGLDGIRNKIEPPPYFAGNIYEARHLPHVPMTLRDSVARFRNSEFAKQAFGADVVEHYAHFYQNEVDAFDKVVTDWERKRYFEQI